MAWRAVRVAGVTGALAVVIGAVLVAAFAGDAASADPDADPVLSDRPGALQIVALGDSYMSGEGAATFYKGTDRGIHSCRRAPTAYPVLVAKALDAQLTFAACSGAKAINIGDHFEDPDTKSQRQNHDEPLQIDTLREHPDADIVILSVGGNDAGFANVVMTCSGKQRGCVDLADPWLSALDPGLDEGTANAADGHVYLLQSLHDVMAQIREAAPHARYYVTTYPNPLSAEECDDIGMDKAESRFLAHEFLPRLNDEIRLAADFEQFTVIPLFDVFDDTGLCAHGQHQHGPAMNPWRFQKTDGFTLLPNSLLRGSMHPTETGHELIAAKVEQVVREDPAQPPEPPEPPGPPPDVAPPGEGPPDVPPPSEGPSTLPPVSVPPPEGPYTDLRANPCTTRAESARFAERPEGPLVIADAMPASTACVAPSYEQPFEEHMVDASGKLVVDTPEPVSDPGGRREALYQDGSGDWVWYTEFPPPGTQESALKPWQAWLPQPWWMWVLGAIGALLLLAVLIEPFLYSLLAESPEP